MEKQKEFFNKVFPEKIETGKNPSSFDWMVSRVRDGLENATPREIIHLLNEAKALQIKNFETGTLEDSFPELISRAAIKEALHQVSSTKLDQTLYQEYPELKPYIQALSKRRTEQNIKTLSKIYGTPPQETLKTIHKLMEIGLFSERKSRKNVQSTYWVPFIFRPALEMVQGKESISAGRIPQKNKISNSPQTQIPLFENI